MLEAAKLDGATTKQLIDAKKAMFAVEKNSNHCQGEG
jgi:hypothetical protein